MKCRNCSEEYLGNYCPNCGQKFVGHGLDIREIISDFLDSFNFDKGFLLTLKLLFLSPSILVNNYINGTRKKYFNPIKFLVLFISFQVIVQTLINDEGNEIELMNNPFWILFSFLVFIPVLSVFSYFISRKKYSYTENLVVNFYILGILNLFALLSGIIRKALFYFDLNSIWTSVLLVFFLPVSYIAYVYCKLYKKNYFYTLVISILSYSVSIAVFLIAFDIFGIIDLDTFTKKN